MSDIAFEQFPSPTGKTSIYKVVSKVNGTLLGTISWYGRWRQYVFEAEPNMVWSYGCLNDVMLKVIAANDYQRQKKAKPETTSQEQRR